MLTLYFRDIENPAPPRSRSSSESSEASTPYSGTSNPGSTHASVHYFHDYNVTDAGSVHYFHEDDIMEQSVHNFHGDAAIGYDNQNYSVTPDSVSLDSNDPQYRQINRTMDLDMFKPRLDLVDPESEVSADYLWRRVGLAQWYRVRLGGERSGFDAWCSRHFIGNAKLYLGYNLAYI